LGRSSPSQSCYSGLGILIAAGVLNPVSFPLLSPIAAALVITVSSAAVIRNARNLDKAPCAATSIQ
jgi:cation transport ATPase